jgi:hypothetical protein
VLFDIADQKLTDDEDQKLAEAFEHFEQNIVGTPAYERLRDIIAKLAAKYVNGVPVT